MIYNLIFNLILNLYLILLFKTIKKKSDFKFNYFIFEIKPSNLIFFIIFIFFSLYLYINFIFKYKIIYIFSIYSSIEILIFLFLCLFIQVYYNFYFYLNKDNIEYFIYKYALSPKLDKYIFFLISSILFITVFFYFNIIIYIIILIYYSLYKFIYNFDQTFDDAFFYLNSGYKIRLRKSGLRKIKKYQKFLLFFIKREEKDCYFIWGKDFFFKNKNNNERYKRGYL